MIAAKKKFVAPATAHQLTNVEAISSPDASMPQTLCRFLDKFARMSRRKQGTGPMEMLFIASLPVSVLKRI